VVAEPIQWQIHELRSDHDRAEFSCGHDSLDTFLKKFATQNQKSGVSQTFVALKPGGLTVHGYYSLAAGSVKFQDLSETQRKGLPRHPVPVVLLGRLAVDKRAQKQGLGEHLLLDAMRRIDQTAAEIGIHAIEVDAIDDSAKQFYLRYGFTELLDDPRHLYIPMKTVRMLKLT
jgi:GNAT superfamily N-acetyltransferase